MTAWTNTLVLLCLVSTASAQTNVLSANYDNNRTNLNSAESILTLAAVASGSFGKLAAVPVDGQIYAQPLYASGVPIAGQQKNVVFVATMNDSLYALDADAPSAPPLWQINFGNPVPSTALPDFADISTSVGILGTPVIDATQQAIFVVSDTYEGGAPVFRLHALSLSTGQEILNGPVEIQATVAGEGAGSVDESVNFDPFWQLQRPGLALANGMVYIGFGSHGDAGPYHGWLIAYNSSNLQAQTGVFNSTPNGTGGAIWQSGRAPAIDTAGNIYVVSGNGDFDGTSNFGGCVLKLSGSDLSLLDWYTPAGWKYLDDNDLDVGSTGPLLVPGGNLLITADKGGRIIYLDPNNLGHIESKPGADEFTASPAGIFQLALGTGVRNPLLYEHDFNGPLKAYPVGAGSVSSTAASQDTNRFDSLYQGLAISSNQGANAILWEITGDHTRSGFPATLHAFDASDVSQELWNSDGQPSDAVGAFGKFTLPLIANGRVYVPTFSNALVVYGMLPASPAESAPQISAVLNAASLVAGAVAPGEIVTILGSNLGPQAGVNLQLNDSGNVSSSLAGTQVFFDGTAAPLLYVSASQINAVVPYEIASSSATEMVVAVNGASSAGVSIAVAPASPAIFSSSGLGTFQGAILNADGTINSPNNPAAAGSMISIYATGLGQTAPPAQDGSVAQGAAPAQLPVSVVIGNLPAYVVYAGAAPGLVAGAFQINVRVPALASSDPDVLMSIQAGAISGPVGITLAVQ